MRNIMLKEMKLSASVVTYLFVVFGLMFFLPGYPILCGAFFVTLGIFQSFQNSRETNDILFSALLPIAKRDVVKGKYLFVCLIEVCSLVLMAVAVAVRMTVLSHAAVYRNNALMNANLFALGMALLIFGVFNFVFVSGFFRTGYKFGRPFVTYIVVGFLLICLGESLHFIPGMSVVNAFGFDSLGIQLILFALGLLAYLGITLGAYRLSCRRFERIDL